MRESIGGSWLLGFVVLFIVLFSSYLAISINYSKAFKVKNKIINIIEQSEGFTPYAGGLNLNSVSTEELKNDESTEAAVVIALKEMGYYTTTIFPCNDKQSDPNQSDPNQKESSAGGYCLKKIHGREGNYYKITTFIKFDLPLINLSIKIPITGETKSIYYDKSGE